MKNEIRESIDKFILGGNADFCIIQDGATDIVGRKLQSDIKYRYLVRKGKSKGVFLVSGGKTGEGKLEYLGTLRITNNRYDFRHVSGLSAIGYVVARGLIWVLNRSNELPSRVHVVHNGKCAVCGRTLLDADSVARGVGPTCAKKIGI